ncbi:hypothetical protein pb186bvf_008734 [Paramecium bursaria]
MTTVLITGSNRGLGKALAEKLAQTGYTVIITARDQHVADQAAQEIINLTNNKNVLSFALDVADVNSITHLHDALVQKQIKLDVLVNNAGINDYCVPDTPERGQQIINVNFYGVINTTTILKPLLADDAKIIVLSSELGQLKLQTNEIQQLLSVPQTKETYIQLANTVAEGFRKNRDISPFNNNPIFPLPPYCASKAVLNAYLRFVLVNEIGANQSLYVVCPGWCKTGLGGPHATYEIEEGIIVSYHLIHNLKAGRQPEHARFWKKLDGQDRLKSLNIDLILLIIDFEIRLVPM